MQLILTSISGAKQKCLCIVTFSIGYISVANVINILILFEVQ